MKEERAWSFDLATKLGREIRSACPLVISIRDNRIVDGLGRWAKELEALNGPGYDMLTEVAVGTGCLSPDRVDWSRNCLLNEGACGIHVGIGNTVSSVHFDFISTQGRLDDI